MNRRDRFSEIFCSNSRFVLSHFRSVWDNLGGWGVGWGRWCFSFPQTCPHLPHRGYGTDHPPAFPQTLCFLQLEWIRISFNRCLGLAVTTTQTELQVPFPQSAIPLASSWNKALIISHYLGWIPPLDLTPAWSQHWPAAGCMPRARMLPTSQRDCCLHTPELPAPLTAVGLAFSKSLCEKDGSLSPEKPVCE